MLQNNIKSSYFNSLKKPVDYWYIKRLHFILTFFAKKNQEKILFINTSNTPVAIDTAFVTRYLSKRYNHLYVIQEWFPGTITNSLIGRFWYARQDLDLSNFFYWPNLVFLLNIFDNKLCLNELKTYQIPLISILSNKSKNNKMYDKFVSYPIQTRFYNSIFTLYYYNKYIIDFIEFTKFKEEAGPKI